jgi:hypothetical protein
VESRLIAGDGEIKSREGAPHPSPVLVRETVEKSNLQTNSTGRVIYPLSLTNKREGMNSDFVGKFYFSTASREREDK